MKFKNGIINVLVGVISQVIIIGLGVVVPRFILVNYGSEVNGIFNSVSQIYAYIALLEAGAGAATLQTLYRHIGKGSHDDISSILSCAHGFYKKISNIYTLCVIVFGLVFAFGTQATVSRLYILLIFWLQGIAGVINFRFVAAEKMILTAEGKNYITSGVTTISTIVTSIGKIILVNLQINIVLLQVFYCVITISQLLFFYIYFKKNYAWIDLKAAPNREALRSKNDFLITEIAWTIFNCTDTILLSFFCDFKVVSVYAIYNLVFSSLSTLLNTVYTGTQFILSRTYHEDIKEYVRLHDLYECLFDYLIYATMAVCCVVILPFIKLYTAGVNDIEYVDVILPILFSLVILISWSRYVSGNLVNISGHIKKVTKISIAEAATNIIVSLVLVNFIGIYGVLLGTIVALLFKSIYLIIYSNKKILGRSSAQSFKTIAVNAVMFAVTLLVSNQVNMTAVHYGQWILKAAGAACIIYAVFLIVNILFNRKTFQYLCRLVKAKFFHGFAKKGN